jgi:ornithine cyclodeaminase/alanine dehydrogenase-like protein (mu-crystallin family)
MQWECLRKHTYVTTVVGGYISTYDVEDDDIAAANITGDNNDHETSEEEILVAHDTGQYKTVIVQ